ncbi:Protein of unknown function [Propionibacterium freudenreichii subsp. freudenreichii]|uniref:Uncharacterized protein n=1 Tax=Propionibacterium freudenreichii subsp. freudenreichii TaxID=66712 RepID=A0A0B7NVX3_PROFF|nr:Protein of unknown function [Propionibacterium freudenreichii]CEP26916.1 Protein of unknown function [Propionibacterium freudenreichii subsp. freudenreichii]CEG97879.1 Protein of unknown function [Propionibacterium freudenreichii]CEH05522.1 Protein of unknown function [Propionibacterium freudenreichii]CEH06617.1 Protein of unknown function [Propionibacterium freudenreichii]
MEADLPRDI